MADGKLVQALRGTLHPDDGTDQDFQTDRQLLRRFVEGDDQDAFGVLVRRHGSLVLGVCCRLLGQVQDAEDAFQATFLVLARKAPWLPCRSSLRNWIFEVAYRTARKASANRARRRHHEHQAALQKQAQDAVTWSEVRGLLDEELYRLPEKYRCPLLLCYLEGKTQDEAAREIGISVGALRGRLHRGRQQLRSRLVRRGFTLSSALATLMLTRSTSRATMPGLFDRTAHAALEYLAGHSVVGLVSTQALGLAEGVISMMFTTKLTKVLLAVLLVGCVLLGGGGLALHSTAARENVRPPQKMSGKAYKINITRRAVAFAPLPKKLKEDLSGFQPIQLRKGGVWIQPGPADDLPTGLFTVGLYTTFDHPGARWVYQRRLKNLLAEGYNEIVARLPGVFPPGARFKVGIFERVGARITLVISILHPPKAQDGKNRAVYLLAPLPLLPQGRYTVQVMTRHTYPGKRKAVPGKKPGILSCRLTYPATAQAIELGKMVRWALTLKPVSLKGRKGDQGSTGLDLTRMLQLTHQSRERAHAGKDHRLFQQRFAALVRTRRTWALCSLLDHPNADARLYATRSLVELADANSVAVLLAAAKRNNYFVDGSENATIHSMYRQTLKTALQKITGLALTPVGLSKTVYEKPGKGRVIRSRDNPKAFPEEVDFSRVERWLRVIYLPAPLPNERTRG